MINQSLNGEKDSTPFRLHPFPILMQEFFSKVNADTEVSRLLRLSDQRIGAMLKHTPDPVPLLVQWTSNFFRMQPLHALLIVSNIIFMLFLWELFQLLNRFVTPDVAASGTLLAVLLPTSYELSLGSSFVTVCYLTMLIIRHALDNQWLIAGLGAAVLSAFDPIVVGLLPLVLSIFWYFQRHFFAAQIIKRACFFFLPLFCMILWRFDLYRDIPLLVQQSAIVHVYHAALQHQAGISLLNASLGQTLTIILLLVGGIIAFVVNFAFVHKIIPLYFLFALLAFSPYGEVASRASLAVACLQGISSVATRPILRLLVLLMLIFGVIEVVAAFR